MSGPDATQAALERELRTSLKSQYHSALAMLKESIEQCPEETWYDETPKNACWQLAYHTLFFTHLYLQPDEAAFRPWPGQRSDDVQYPDGIARPANPDNPLPLVPSPYSKDEVLAYWEFCDRIVDGAVETLDFGRKDSGFNWVQMPKLEHQIVNVRHVQHHAAQLVDRVRAAAGVGVRWAGSRRPR